MGALAGVGTAVEGGGKAIVMVQLAVNIALSGSLQLLWGMVNTLQIIVHMPLVEVAMPQNALLLSSFLNSLASFDVLPTDFITDKLAAL